MLALALQKKYEACVMHSFYQRAGMPVSLAECHVAVPGCRGGTSSESSDES